MTSDLAHVFTNPEVHKLPTKSQSRSVMYHRWTRTDVSQKNSKSHLAIGWVLVQRPIAYWLYSCADNTPHAQSKTPSDVLPGPELQIFEKDETISQQNRHKTQKHQHAIAFNIDHPRSRRAPALRSDSQRAPHRPQRLWQWKRKHLYQRSKYPWTISHDLHFRLLIDSYTTRKEETSLMRSLVFTHIITHYYTPSIGLPRLYLQRSK